MTEKYSMENDPVYINLQTELVWLQQWIIKKKKRVVVIFEGRDTAGKGGAIMRFVRFLNPRAYRVVALGKPSKAEKGQWFFQRYIEQLPDPGEMVFFDRSWYNRAIVEPVMEFCTQKQYELFMQQVNLLEQMLSDDGITIVKFWFSITSEEQDKRLTERKTNPLTQWKLSTVDMMAQLKWEEYREYKEKMFAKTGTPHLPWVIVQGNNKDQARLEAMRYVIGLFNYPEKGKTRERLSFDPEIITFENNAPTPVCDV